MEPENLYVKLLRDDHAKSLLPLFPGRAYQQSGQQQQQAPDAERPAGDSLRNSTA